MIPNQILHFPEKLILRFCDTETNIRVKNIAVTLTLFAKMKNNYSLGPKLSDSNGKIFIDKTWVNNSIDEIRNFFIMDYVTRLEGCSPFVNIKVMNENEIDRALHAMKMFHLEKGGLGIAHSISDLMRAENSKYKEQSIQIEFTDQEETAKEITIQLIRI